MPRPRGGFQHFWFKPAIPGSGLAGKISFEAHVVNISDNNSPSWGETNDMGRPDPKVMYLSFQRSVSISFIVVAVTEQEHSTNYELMKKLALLTYPIFKAEMGYNAPHVQFRIGNLIQAYGYVTNVDYSWNNDTTWIEDKPILTEANISIRVLTDGNGNRPNYNGGAYNYFGV